MNNPLATRSNERWKGSFLLNGDNRRKKQLDKIVDKINNRPRKVLGYLTPYEVFSP
jgi:hypothetical protein